MTDESSSPTFEWDEEKNRVNQTKHGLSFEAAHLAFLDPRRIITEDLEHSVDEPRLFCLGKVGDGVATVRFTYRGGRVRIFGAGLPATENP